MTTSMIDFVVVKSTYEFQMCFNTSETHNEVSGETMLDILKREKIRCTEESVKSLIPNQVKI
jgi:hypothetical protein